MKSKVKKILALLMAVLMLTLTGCKTAPEDVSKDVLEDAVSKPEATEPLRVLIDVEIGSRIIQPGIKQTMSKYSPETLKGGNVRYNTLPEVIEKLGGPEDIELEFPPKSGEERDAYMTALRTEMMAGKGPDVFVCVSGCAEIWSDDGNYYEDGLFKFPQQAMERNMFLPLDSYIENAQFMEWDKLTPAVMEAGRNDKGQLLLPMTYTIPVCIFRAEDVDFQLDTGLSWKDMLSGSPELLITAADSVASMKSTALAPLADYEKDKLAVTEEELLDYVTSRIDAYKSLQDMDLPDYSASSIMPSYSWFKEELGMGSDLVLVPVYSRGGGYTALITSFLGININTKRPDDAFFVADYLMSQEAQQSSLYNYITTSTSDSVPTMEGLMSGRGYGLSDGNGGNIYMSKKIYERFVELRDGMSGADFKTALESELHQLDAVGYKARVSGKPVETLVHDSYMRMQMMLAES